MKLYDTHNDKSSYIRIQLLLIAIFEEKVKKVFILSVVREKCLICFLETQKLINDRLVYLQIIHLCFKLLQFSIIKPLFFYFYISTYTSNVKSSYIKIYDCYFLNKKTIERFSLDMLRHMVYFLET